MPKEGRMLMRSSWGVQVSDGALESMKWLALVLMVTDHVNSYVLHGSRTSWFELGRIAFPLFGFVFAYNLARISDLEALKRIGMRLLLAGTFAQLAYTLIRGVLPLNIMFLFLAVLLMIWTSTASSGWVEYFTHLVIFLLGGFLVEFCWFGILYVWACWRWCRNGSAIDYFLAMAALLFLYFVNSNLWALAAAPVILIASRVNVAVPRMRGFFYSFYPIHLCVLAVWEKLVLLR